MDIRIIKTKKAIREAFFALRKNQDIEKIKVVDLCSLAVINKTTFYKYYPDIFALADELDNEVFTLFWARFDAKDCFFTDSARFIRELPIALDSVGETLPLLFRDRYNDFFAMLENELIRHYVKPEMDSHEKIRNSFAIRGLVYMFQDIKQNGTYTADELANELSRFI